MIHYKKHLRHTYILAGLVFIGLISWNFYFEDTFDPFREPYSSAAFTDRQVESVETERNEITEDEEINVYGVSAVHPLAADVGMQVIEDGGNAIDAAVAVSFMLNVVEPYGSGIGGGGIMLYHDPEEGVLNYDYRETAPESGAWPDRSVAVPGFVKGMERIHEDHGELEWEQLLTPAIEAAEEGFQVGEIFHQQTGNAIRYLQLDPQEEQLFFPEGQALPMNEMLVQKELAETLRLIRDNKSDGFYSGEIGELLQQELGITKEDLASYEVNMAEPAVAVLGEQTIYGGSSPSSGTVVLQALKLAEKVDMQQVLSDSDIPDDFSMGDLVNYEDLQDVYIHLINEITKVTYRERVNTLGDPNFDDINHETLMSEEYIEGMFDEITFDQITEADTSELFDSPAEENDSRHTSHFVIIDKEGRMVSATHSLGEFYGSGRYMNGFFLNNQMDNFSQVDDSINRYAPGKRPRSFVSPIIFEEQGQPVLGLGTPGGKRIPSMLFQSIMQYNYRVNEDDEAISLQEAIELPRFYNEEEVIYVEDVFPEETTAHLRNMGYSVISHDSPLFYGGIQGLGVILDENGKTQGLYGGGDSRRNGAWQIDSE